MTDKTVEKYIKEVLDQIEPNRNGKVNLLRFVPNLSGGLVFDRGLFEEALSPLYVEALESEEMNKFNKPAKKAIKMCYAASCLCNDVRFKWQINSNIQSLAIALGKETSWDSTRIMGDDLKSAISEYGHIFLDEILRRH